MLCTVLGPVSRRYSTSAMLLSMMCPKAHLRQETSHDPLYIPVSAEMLVDETPLKLSVLQAGRLHTLVSSRSFKVYQTGGSATLSCQKDATDIWGITCGAQ